MKLTIYESTTKTPEQTKSNKIQPMERKESMSTKLSEKLIS